jgi:hypothetical protein
MCRCRLLKGPRLSRGSGLWRPIGSHARVHDGRGKRQDAAQLLQCAASRSDDCRVEERRDFVVTMTGGGCCCCGGAFCVGWVLTVYGGCWLVTHDHDDGRGRGPESSPVTPSRSNMRTEMLLIEDCARHFSCGGSEAPFQKTDGRGFRPHDESSQTDTESTRQRAGFRGLFF